jgi:hypothetical protein
MRPKAFPVTNSIIMAMAFETRRAGPALCIKINGIATGKVATLTQGNTASAPHHSSPPSQQHDQSEEHLGDPLVGLEQTLGNLGGMRGHRERHHSRTKPSLPSAFTTLAASASATTSASASSFSTVWVSTAPSRWPVFNSKKLLSI